MSKDDYLTKVMGHLNNVQFYEKLLDNPAEWFLEEIPFLFDMLGCQVIKRDSFEFLCPRDVRTSQFYSLPELHKARILGRPIILSCGAPTEKISFFIDYDLSPLVKKIPSHIKDTNGFRLKLQSIQDLSSDSLLVTLEGFFFFVLHDGSPRM